MNVNNYHVKLDDDNDQGYIIRQTTLTGKCTHIAEEAVLTCHQATVLHIELNRAETVGWNAAMKAMGNLIHRLGDKKV